MSNDDGRQRNRWFSIAVIILIASCMSLLAACGSGNDDGTTTAAETSQESGGETSSTENASADSDAKAVTEEVYAGARIGEPSSEPNPAVPGKSVWIVNTGAASPTATALTESIEEAVEAIGWTSQTCDGKLDPSQNAACFDQAIAAKPDGIIGGSVDCYNVKSQLKKAAAEGIATVTAFAFDCNELESGGEELFSAPISFGSRYASLVEYLEAAGEDTAAWIVGETETPEVLDLENDEYGTIITKGRGFAKGMERYCPDCENHVVKYLATDFGPKFQSIVSTALTKYPGVNAVQGTYNPQLGPNQAILASGREINNIGGFGIAEDAEAIRDGSGLTATLAQPLKWFGFASVDTMNSLFNEAPVRDSGIGWTIFDIDRNIPPPGENWEPEIDFESAYLKAWGK